MVFLGISIFAHISFRAVSVYMPAHCLSNEQKATRKMRVVLMHRPHAPFIFLVRRCQCPASAPPPFAVRGQLPIALALCIPFDFKMKRDIRSDVSFRGGDKRDRTADLLNAIQALSQLSYTPTGKVYLIRKRHECQERFCILAKKSARRTRRRAELFYRDMCVIYASARSCLTVAADDVRNGGGQLPVAVGVEVLAVERTHLRDRAGVQKPQTICLGDHLILRRHAL